MSDAIGRNIAHAVRTQRLAAGLTMRELATRAGMSQPFLSNLENSRAMPSIATLYKIASALDVSPRDFLPPDHERVVVVRNGEGALGSVDDTEGSATARLAIGAPGRMIEAHTYVVEPGADLGDWFEHEGEELFTVTAGEVAIEFVDGQRYELTAGDLVWHESTLAHRWIASGTEVAHLLVVEARPVPTDAAGHGA
ncbi:helix-turn-helix domain-containing protein [Ilumatobacter sp.]|uniref:helix-turn-helix domain-containing protein n=1 Tax=Ilumatobacter sp. TaxID=1967498 RepID=UPI003C472E45